MGDHKKGPVTGSPTSATSSSPPKPHTAPLLVRAPWTGLPATSPGCRTVPALLSPARDIICVCGDDCALGCLLTSPGPRALGPPIPDLAPQAVFPLSRLT